MIVSRFKSLVLASALILSLSNCGGGGVFDSLVRVFGQALAPVRNLVDANPIPLGDALVSIEDFVTEAVARQNRLTEQGRTDADGNYVVDVEADKVVAVVIDGVTEFGPIRLCRLLNIKRDPLSKIVNALSTLACQAGIDAVFENAISSTQLDDTRIQNLEIAADLILQLNPNLDLYNPVHVAIAADNIRVITGNGDFPPQKGIRPVLDLPNTNEQDPTAGENPTPTPRPTSTPRPTATPTPFGAGCSEGIYTCFDGTTTCRELVCDGTADCADGSDESASVCTAEVNCCISSNGCPGETGGTCTDDCCCCGANQACDQGDFLNGCVASAARTSDDFALETLGKSLGFDIYY